MEYALNSNPLVPNISTLIHDLESLGDGEHLRLTVPKNSAATNLTYTVETCGALNDWSSLDTTVESSSATQLIVRESTEADVPEIRKVIRASIEGLAARDYPLEVLNAWGLDTENAREKQRAAIREGKEINPYSCVGCKNESCRNEQDFMSETL